VRAPEFALVLAVVLEVAILEATLSAPPIPTPLQESYCLWFYTHALICWSHKEWMFAYVTLKTRVQLRAIIYTKRLLNSSIKTSCDCERSSACAGARRGARHWELTCHTVIQAWTATVLAHTPHYKEQAFAVLIGLSYRTAYWLMQKTSWYRWRSNCCKHLTMWKYKNTSESQRQYWIPNVPALIRKMEQSWVVPADKTEKTQCHSNAIINNDASTRLKFFEKNT
jgi:hypothetical protein